MCLLWSRINVFNKYLMENVVVVSSKCIFDFFFAWLTQLNSTVIHKYSTVKCVYRYTLKLVSSVLSDDQNNWNRIKLITQQVVELVHY